jgi:hypothetical protein
MVDVDLGTKCLEALDRDGGAPFWVSRYMQAGIGTAQPRVPGTANSPICPSVTPG